MVKIIATIPLVIRTGTGLLVDKLFDKRYWEGKESYQKKLEFLAKTYNDFVAKGYTFDDFMNNMRSKSGITIQRI